MINLELRQSERELAAANDDLMQQEQVGRAHSCMYVCSLCMLFYVFKAMHVYNAYICVHVLLHHRKNVCMNVFGLIYLYKCMYVYVFGAGVCKQQRQDKAAGERGCRSAQRQARPGLREGHAARKAHHIRGAGHYQIHTYIR